MDYGNGKIALGVVRRSVKNQLALTYISGDYSGLFLTNDPQNARDFSKGAVVTFEIPYSILETMNQKHLLYLGFERSLEVAIAPSPFLYQIMSTFTDAKAAELSRIFSH